MNNISLPQPRKFYDYIDDIEPYLQRKYPGLWESSKNGSDLWDFFTEQYNFINGGMISVSRYHAEKASSYSNYAVESLVRALLNDFNTEAVNIIFEW